jgi:hypothetical protein
VGKNTVIQVLSGIVAIEGLLLFERAVSLKNSIFLFPVAILYLFFEVKESLELDTTTKYSPVY